MVAIQAPMASTPFLHDKVIVVAEAQVLVRKPVEVRLRQLGATVYHCTTRKELLDFCDRLNPHLLLLGTLPKTNSLDLFRQCRNSWHEIPVILLAHQPIVNDYFRDWAMKQGVNNVVSSYPQNFHQVQTAVKDLLFPLLRPSGGNSSKANSKVIPLKPHIKIPAPPAIKLTKISRYQAAIALNQISEFSKKYFGDLAIGNYWRKTQIYLQTTYPLLSKWSADHWGKFDHIAVDPIAQETLLTTDELESLRTWVLLFTKECERIVVDFPQLLQQYSRESINCQYLL